MWPSSLRSRVPSRASASADARRAGFAFLPVAVRGCFGRVRFGFVDAFVAVVFFFVISVMVRRE